MNTKEKIIQATIELAAKKGLSKTSMNDIAEKVGIKKASLYYYYKSKDEMIEDMYHSIRQKNVEYFTIDTSIPFKKFLHDSFTAYLKLCTSSEMKKVFVIIESEKYVNPSAAELYLEETTYMLNLTKRVISKYVEEEKIEVEDIDFASTSYAFYAHELIIIMMLENKVNEEEINMFIDKFIKTFIKEVK